MTNAQIMSLFAAWRADMDSEPFAYEQEWVNFIRRLLGERDGQ